MLNKLLLVVCSLMVSAANWPVGEHSAKQQEKVQIIYVYDPMCGWCYAFSPVVQKIKEKYADKADFAIISGGLAVGENSGPALELAESFEKAVDVIETRTNVTFGQAYLDLLRDSTFLYNSNPPSIALAVVREMKPVVVFEFGIKVQQLLFTDGKNLNDPNSYALLCEEFGIDKTEFVSKMNDPSFQAKAEQDFKKAIDMGVGGFPALLIKSGNKVEIISRGYLEYDKLNRILAKYFK